VTCERCGSGRAAHSHRLRQPVCWRCYHCTFTAAELAEAERVETQHGLAKVIRGVAERVEGCRERQLLRDRAGLIEVAERDEDAIALVDQVRALGVRLKVVR
jgi:hypothetical protein